MSLANPAKLGVGSVITHRYISGSDDVNLLLQSPPAARLPEQNKMAFQSQSGSRRQGVCGRPVAVCALAGGWLIEKNVLTLNRPEQIMTLVTFHVRVPALQWKVGAEVMIEGRRRPSHDIVAIGADRFSLLGSELPAMSVQVTDLALLRRP
jgi:hypothetical protein